MKLKLCLVITLLSVSWLGSVISQDLCEVWEPSERLLGYALKLNGLFIAGNPKDSQSPSAREDLTMFSFRPVDIPVLQPGITFYFEFSLVGLKNQQRILRLTDTDDGLVKIEMYSFSDPSKFVRGTFGIANLTALRESDIDLNTEPCTIFFKERCDGSYVEVSGTPICIGYNRFKGLVTCTAVTIIFKTGKKIRHRKFGDRYQLSPFLEEKTRNLTFRGSK